MLRRITHIIPALVFCSMAASAGNKTVLNEKWNVRFIKTTEDSITSKIGVFSVAPLSNLDDYYGYRQLKHGNLHGSAQYETVFTQQTKKGKRYLLQFEGVGTYATVTLNGKTYEKELVGRTTYTFDVTSAIKNGKNTLRVLVDHPAYQTACPWVCGGCSAEWGFSEGSQPFGIYRPVNIIETSEVAVEPFGVHIYSNAACDSVFVNTEVTNYSSKTVKASVENMLLSADNSPYITLKSSVKLAPGETKVVCQKQALNKSVSREMPHRWSLSDPYLYLLRTRVNDDVVENEFGFRTISWPLHRNDGTGTFKLNGNNLFINGTCDYEHIFGESHAFTREEIEARMKMMHQAGFNAFREAHQPHNLYYQQLLDEQGMLFWSQFSAHIWYDTPQFRDTFKAKLRQWIRERRNSPSVILWGLQNESILPEDFARECSDIIREMDPTCRDQRAITTCNGGTGTDWNVIQNWSGTYGGNMYDYDKELMSSTQLLNGEYGAWRTLGLHGEHKYSEEKALHILSTKSMKALSVRDSVCGHFQWPFVSHDNPGRIQPDESIRMIDKVGPFNYKGLLTPWEQPTNLYWWYHQNIVNEDLNDKIKALVASTDKPKAADITLTEGSQQVLYRINCGGDAYVDSKGNVWSQDNTDYSQSWAEALGMHPFTASQGHMLTTDGTNVDIAGTTDDNLFRYFRWGRHKLTYSFPVPDGDYHVELYFAEPWLGANDTKDYDYSRLRLFDVAINNETVIKDLDLWKEAGYAGAIKKEINVTVKGGMLRIHFPNTKVGEAVISAIAIVAKDKNAGSARNGIINKDNASSDKLALPANYWTTLDTDGIAAYPKEKLPQVVDLPAVKYEQTSPAQWTITPGIGKEYMLRFRYKNFSEKAIKARMKIIDSKNIVMQDTPLTLPPTPNKFKVISTVTSSQINAGTYRVILSDYENAEFETLEVQ